LLYNQWIIEDIQITDRSQNKDLTVFLQVLEKQEQAKHKVSRRKIITVRAEINEIERKKIQRISETKVVL
jgi:hypothetical protein